jgi:hypothetical protein
MIDFCSIEVEYGPVTCFKHWNVVGVIQQRFSTCLTGLIWLDLWYVYNPSLWEGHTLAKPLVLEWKPGQGEVNPVPRQSACLWERNRCVLCKPLQISELFVMQYCYSNK